MSHSFDSSNVIEDIILETVHSKLGINFEFKKDYKFSDYIKELRKKRRSDQVHEKFDLEKSWLKNIQGQNSEKEMRNEYNSK